MTPSAATYKKESADLPAHWERLDSFEGPGCSRVVTTVSTAVGDVAASIYVLAQSEPEPRRASRG